MADEISQTGQGRPEDRDGEGEPASAPPEVQSSELTLPFLQARWQRFVAATRAASAPVLRTVGVVGGKQLRRSSVRSRRVLAERVGPALAGPARRLGRRLSGSSLRRDHKRLLLTSHALFLDRPADKLFFIPTRGHVSLIGLKIPAQVRRTAHDYKPTPRRVFEWAMSAVRPPLERTVFVDFGAGRGRVLLLASHHPFARIVGAEIAAELHDDCLMNIAQYPRSLMKCRNVECEQVRATALPIPEEPVVFYFFNPFDTEIVLKVLDRIERSYKQQRRQMHLICVDMGGINVAETHGVFQPVAFSVRQRLTHKLLSPYSIQVYRTEP